MLWDLLVKIEKQFNTTNEHAQTWYYLHAILSTNLPTYIQSFLVLKG
jgi:hypothetical protein